MQPTDHVWVVILAAGEGRRVQALTRDRRGRPAPKQYSLVGGHTTLLDLTLARARRLAPPERIVAVVAAQHRSWWVSELAGLPAPNVIVQPENRGTAAGILLPLMWILRQDPFARLAILPSDHGVAAEETLHKAIIDALACAPRPDSEMVLLGVQPQGPETDYGWIVPKAGRGGPLRRVACFREKPDAGTAAELLSREGMLNSFILIVGGRSLLALFRTSLPQLWRSFRPMLENSQVGFRSERNLSRVYQSVPTFDFSKDLLEKAADTLWVHQVPACGWLDLGTQDRLTCHLLKQGQHSLDGPPAGVTRRQHRTPRLSPTSREATEPAAGAGTRAVA
jgi:mannose-1-phosphate guanylyltransferase